MGLFSNLRKQNAIDTTTARAMLVMPLLSAAADGKLEQSELNEIAMLCSQNPIFLNLGGKVTKDLMDAIVKDLGKRGSQAVFVDAVAALPPKLRETALCFAVRVAAADGHIDPKEINTLQVMGESMQIPEARFLQIVEVLMMLHRSEAA